MVIISDKIKINCHRKLSQSLVTIFFEKIIVKFALNYIQIKTHIFYKNFLYYKVLALTHNEKLTINNNISLFLIKKIKQQIRAITLTY